MLYLFNQPNIVEQLMQAPITAVLVFAMVIVSYLAFNDEALRNKLLFVPAYMEERGANQLYRFITHGFIHADWLHLAFNAYVLWEFGRVVETLYKLVHGNVLGSIFYVLLFFGGLVASSLYSYYKHRHHYGYAALGASGAVSGVLFSAIVFMPLMPLGLMFIPFVEIPAIIMGIAYLAYSTYMSRRGGDNIGHDAHFWGSVWGFVFTLVLAPQLFPLFLNQIFGR